MTALLALLLWTIDRFEPPWAVLLDQSGRQVDVPLTWLPAAARPGDALATPHGPVIGDRAARAAALRRRIERLAGLASSAGVGHRAPMAGRQQDHFARRAQREGFAARSVYKLEEIDGRVHLLRGGQRVLDLGCSPGSWLQYAARVVGSKGRVVGLDLKPIDCVLPPHVTTYVADAFETPTADLLAWGDGPFDVVLSDMAPATSGHRLTDHVRSVELCRRALEVAGAVLRPGGAFVCKVFEGEDLADLAADVRQRFRSLKRVKPRSTRSESVELFLVAQGHHPEGAP